MAEEKKRMTPIIALRQFFGMRPGQSLKEFGDEIKQLSEAEKLYLAQEACKELGTELDMSKGAGVTAAPATK